MSDLPSIDPVDGIPTSLNLSALHISRTAADLCAAVEAQLPDRDLGQLADDVAVLTKRADGDIASYQQRLHRARLVSLGIVAVIAIGTLAAFVLAIRNALQSGGLGNGNALSLIETVIDDLVYASIAVAFLMALPDRLQRRGVLALLHRMRALAHIIDMHQLTKQLAAPGSELRTTKAANLDLDADQLDVYLQYCSELLGLVGKAAALFGEESGDPVVLQTVADIEDLTSGMIHKIWLKIAAIPRM